MSSEFHNATRDVFPTLAELFAAGEDVESLQAHPGWTHVCRLVDAEIALIDTRLDGPPLESRAAYAHLLARRSGLNGFRAAAEAIRSRAALRRAQQQAKHEGAAPALEGSSG